MVWSENRTQPYPFAAGLEPASSSAAARRGRDEGPQAGAQPSFFGEGDGPSTTETPLPLRDRIRLARAKAQETMKQHAVRSLHRLPRCFDSVRGSGAGGGRRYGGWLLLLSFVGLLVAMAALAFDARGWVYDRFVVDQTESQISAGVSKPEAAALPSSQPHVGAATPYPEGRPTRPSFGDPGFVAPDPDEPGGQPLSRRPRIGDRAELLAREVVAGAWAESSPSAGASTPGSRHPAAGAPSMLAVRPHLAAASPGESFASAAGLRGEGSLAYSSAAPPRPAASYRAPRQSTARQKSELWNE